MTGAVPTTADLRLAEALFDLWDRGDCTSPEVAHLIARHRQQAEARATSGAGEDEKANLGTIDERDLAEGAFSDAYRQIVGREPQWSNLFSYDDAIADMVEAASPTEAPGSEGAGDRETGRRWIISEARKTLRLVQGCLECSADDERRWSETIEWLEKLA